MRNELQLEEILHGKVVIVGVGNRLKGDDGLGPVLVERLQGKVKVPCVNAENTLGNYVGKILAEKPDTVLLIDAAHLDREPGAYVVMEPEEIVQTGMSTHDVSLKLYVDLLLNENVGKVYVLGVQPQQLELGSDLSEAMEKTLRHLEHRIASAVGAEELAEKPAEPLAEQPGKAALMTLLESAEALPRVNRLHAPQASTD